MENTKFKINLKATNIELSDEIRNFANNQIFSIEKFINERPDDEIIVDCEIGKTTRGQNSGDIYRAEINMILRGEMIRTESVKDHLYLAIEESVNEMIRRVRKNKERKHDLFKRGAKAIKKLLRRG